MASKYCNPDRIKLDRDAKIVFVADANPRKIGTRGYAFWPRYAVGLTIGELLDSAKNDKLNDAPGHLRWDLSRGAVRLDPEPEAVAAFVPPAPKAPEPAAVGEPEAGGPEPAAVGEPEAGGPEPAPEPAPGPSLRKRGARAAAA
jgi:hypothetical protein